MVAGSTGLVFSGQGAQWAGMSAELRVFPVFAEVFDAIVAQLDPVLEQPDPAIAVAALPALRREPAAERRARMASLAGIFSRERAAREMAEVYWRLARSV